MTDGKHNEAQSADDAQQISEPLGRVEALLSQMATRSDVEEIRSTVESVRAEVREARHEASAEKKSLKNLHYDLRAELLVKNDRLERHFDVVAENIHQDVAAAGKDEISGLDTRVTALEERAGIR